MLNSLCLGIDPHVTSDGHQGCLPQHSSRHPEDQHLEMEFKRTPHPSVESLQAVNTTAGWDDLARGLSMKNYRAFQHCVVAIIAQNGRLENRHQQQ